MSVYPVCLDSVPNKWALTIKTYGSTRLPLQLNSFFRHDFNLIKDAISGMQQDYSDTDKGQPLKASDNQIWLSSL
jgi:hypothetical protein